MWIFLALFLIFLIGASLLQTTSTSFRVLEQSHSRAQLQKTQAFFFYRSLERLFFADRELEVLFFVISCTKHIARFSFAAMAALFSSSWLLFLGLLLSLILADFLPRLWATRHPLFALRLTAPLASPYILLATPLCYLLLLVGGRRFTSLYIETIREPVANLKEKIIEMVEQADAKTVQDQDEKRLLQSVADFRDTLVKEIMVPRVDMDCLPETATLREAAALFDKEEYSRLPVYRETVDQIVGMLLFKDLARIYHHCEAGNDWNPLEGTIADLLKPVPYVPETSRVSRVLREFRQQQTHMAIVVDEYGGTEGLVTIEDCIEEIVGEISDEYDDEERLYTPQPDGSWVIDARMSLNDIESTFDLEIPQEGDYDTIGGYAFHCAGEIPAPGMRIQRDAFEIEVLASSERCVDRVRLIPR